MNFGAEGIILVYETMETVTMDRYGRVKLPAAFREMIENFGKEVFVTSPDGKSVWVYPIYEWDRVSSAAGESTRKNPAMRRCLMWLNSFGVKSEIDGQGRVKIGKELMSKTGLAGRIEIDWQKSRLSMKKAVSG